VANLSANPRIALTNIRGNIRNRRTSDFHDLAREIEMPEDASALERWAKSLAGKRVRAQELVGPDSDHPPRELTGVLQVVHVRTLDYDRFSINGIGIVVSSIELMKDD
jgi:hypothetical protein